MKKTKAKMVKAKKTKPKRAMAKLHQGIKKHLKDDIKMFNREAQEDKALIKKMKRK